jgi:MFS family permease
MSNPSDNAELPPLPHSHRPGTARAAFAYRDYRLVWTSMLLSNIGTWMQNLALPAYIDDRTGSAKVVSLLVFAQLGPLLLLAIPGGIIANRFNLQRYLLFMQWVQLVFSLVLAAIVSVDGPIWRKHPSGWPTPSMPPPSKPACPCSWIAVIWPVPSA